VKREIWFALSKMWLPVCCFVGVKGFVWLA
jgi:hypothetical protein